MNSAAQINTGSNRLAIAGTTAVSETIFPGATAAQTASINGNIALEAPYYLGPATPVAGTRTFTIADAPAANDLALPPTSLTAVRLLSVSPRPPLPAPPAAPPKPADWCSIPPAPTPIRGRPPSASAS